MPDRSDPLTDRLARFTPSGAGLDRDAVLFAAGRQSARVSRLWPAAAALLAVSQVVTLIVLWPHDPPAPVVGAPSPPAVPPPPLILPPASPDPDVWTVRSRFPDVLQEPPTASPGEFVSSGPPLTAGSGRRFD
jgi:hypothetical protein